MKRGSTGRNHLLILVLPFLLLALSGCQGGFGFGKQPGTQDLGAFIGGTQGLQVAFAEDQPPAAVLDSKQEQFSITLILKNLGEYTIPAGGITASLSGVVQQSFSLPRLDVKNDFEIFGVTKQDNSIIEGGQEFLEFGQASFTPDLPADTQLTLKADICYNYQTQAVTTLCLKKNVLKKEIGDVCSVNNPAPSFDNSGAPMQIADIKESSIGTNKIRVSFKVVNQGIGAVYAPNTFSKSCLGMEDRKNTVHVSATSPETTLHPQCTQLGGGSKGVIKLINNQKDITCTIDTQGLQEVTFQDLMIITLDYTYREAVVVPITIVNSA